MTDETMDVTIKDVPVETVRWWTDAGLTSDRIRTAARAALARLESGAPVETVEVRADDLRAVLDRAVISGWSLMDHAARLRAALAEREAQKPISADEARERRCKTCGAPVRVLGGIEGTCSYQPLGDDLADAVQDVLGAGSHMSATARKHLIAALDTYRGREGVNARFIVGDSLTVLRSMPDASVDVVITSPPGSVTRRYPLQPLADALGVSLASLGRHLSVSGTQWQQYRDQGVTERVADRLAVKAGYAPAEVWPELLDHAIDDAEAEREARRTKDNAMKRLRYQQDAQHRADKIARNRAYKEATRAVTRKAAARDYAENGEARRAQKRQHYAENRDQILARRRDLYAINERRKSSENRQTIHDKKIKPAEAGCASTTAATSWSPSPAAAETTRSLRDGAHTSAPERRKDVA